MVGITNYQFWSKFKDTRHSCAIFVCPICEFRKLLEILAFYISLWATKRKALNGNLPLQCNALLKLISIQRNLQCLLADQVTRGIRLKLKQKILFLTCRNRRPKMTVEISKKSKGKYLQWSTFFFKKKERISLDFFKGFFLGHFHSFYYPRETSPENWRKEQRKTIIYDKFLSCASKTLKQLVTIEKRFSNFISLSWRRSLSYRNQSIDSKIDRYAAVFSSQLQARRKWHSTMIDN